MKKIKKRTNRYRVKLPTTPTSDNAVVAQAISVWAFIILVAIVLGIFIIIFACRKTSSAVSSYQEWRQESKETKAAQKEIAPNEKRCIASKKAEKEKVEAATKEKVAVKKIDPLTGAEDQGNTYTLLVMYLCVVGIFFFIDWLVGSNGILCGFMFITGIIAILLVWFW